MVTSSPRSGPLSDGQHLSDIKRMMIISLIRPYSGRPSLALSDQSTSLIFSRSECLVHQVFGSEWIVGSQSVGMLGFEYLVGLLWDRRIPVERITERGNTKPQVVRLDPPVTAVFAPPAGREERRAAASMEAPFSEAPRAV